MKKEYIFPIILMTMNLGAAITYLSQGDIKRFIYWLAAIVLTACVTF